jgi:hypothetical protein
MYYEMLKMKLMAKLFPVLSLLHWFVTKGACVDHLNRWKCDLTTPTQAKN